MEAEPDGSRIVQAVVRFFQGARSDARHDRRDSRALVSRRFQRQEAGSAQHHLPHTVANPLQARGAREGQAAGAVREKEVRRFHVAQETQVRRTEILAAHAMKAFPMPALLQGYSAPRLRLDAIAGLSLAAFAIPESLAYASLAGLPPVSGLYCYLVAGVAYAIFGASRQLAVGPTSALAIAVAASIAALGGGDTARVVALGAGIALLVGLIGVGGRYLGLANVAHFLSDTVVTGFKTGAAIYI